MLVNNAGVYEFSPIGEVTEDKFHRLFNTNVLGLLLASQQAANLFGPEGGSIINIGSVVSRITPPGSSIYSATKSAVDAVTGALARELGPKKIRVNSINPGMVETEGVHSAGFIGSDFEKGAVAQTPLGRIAQPDDIAPLAVFLASSDSGWLTGETIRGFRRSPLNGMGLHPAAPRTTVLMADETPSVSISASHGSFISAETDPSHPASERHTRGAMARRQSDATYARCRDCPPQPKHLRGGG